MPRPRKCRHVEQEPVLCYFKPWGVPLVELTEVCLPVEGLEALRLADLEGVSMEAAAARMQISRHTFGRILADARGKVAEALVHGRALRIEGGNYALRAKKAAAGTRVPAHGGAMTKVAVTSEGPTLDDRVDPRFGRAGGFVLVDVESMEYCYVDNGASQALAQGAGIQAAERVASSGAEVVLSGYVGPKAFSALSAAGIRVGQDLDGLTVREAVERYKAGQVAFFEQPNKQD